jgi:high-affinity nickel permease
MRGRDAPLHPGSAAVALVVGGIEVLGLLVDRLHLTGSFWGLMGQTERQFRYNRLFYYRLIHSKLGHVAGLL